MEYRKLIAFGQSSFVISLPKAWINQNKVKKGDLIYLEENGANLLLSKTEQKEGKETKSIIINIDGKTKDWVGREVCSAYILNNHEIILKGKEVKTKIKEFQSVIQNLIALEIMEQTTDSLVAKDFLNMDNVSLYELIKKMDVVTRTMIKEGMQVFSDCNYESINDRDKDVNRLYFLVYRTVLYNLENQSKALKNYGLTPLDLLKIRDVCYYIEIIADEIRRAVRFARMMKIPAEKEREITTFIEKVDEYYLETMKAFYKKDVNLALQLSELKIKYDTTLDDFEKDVQKYPYMNRVNNQLRRMLTNIHNLGRVIYTLP